MRVYEECDSYAFDVVHLTKVFSVYERRVVAAWMIAFFDDSFRMKDFEVRALIEIVVMIR